MSVDELESSYLDACRELVARQQEVSVALALALKVPPNRLFYTWTSHQCEQTGTIPGTDWHYFFHGFECDLQNQADGRHLRVEFGPSGRLDILTATGVLQFVMTSKAPWREFSRLQSHFADQPPPSDSRSGSHARSDALFRQLEKRGFVEPSAPDLCKRLEEWTKTDADGSRVIVSPKGTPWETQLDLMVAARRVISPAGWKALSDGRR